LLIDDDVELCALLAEYLGEHGLQVDASHDGANGLRLALEGRYDLVLLDVMLPKLQGFEMLRRLRQRTKVPVIMLTARIGEHDRVNGLDGGADDYVLKPFAAVELLSRIRAVLRRVQERMPDQPAHIEINGIRLNVRTHQAWVDGEPVDLTSTEFEILELLVRSPGRIVSRDEIVAALHQREATAHERSLDVHMSHIRAKLKGRGGALIRTVRGVGYVFAEVE
jgi:two-component system response regulator CpxR